MVSNETGERVLPTFVGYTGAEKVGFSARFNIFMWSRGLEGDVLLVVILLRYQGTRVHLYIFKIYALYLH